MIQYPSQVSMASIFRLLYLHNTQPNGLVKRGMSNKEQKTKWSRVPTLLSMTTWPWKARRQDSSTSMHSGLHVIVQHWVRYWNPETTKLSPSCDNIRRSPQSWYRNKRTAHFLSLFIDINKYQGIHKQPSVNKNQLEAICITEEATQIIQNVYI